MANRGDCDVKMLDLRLVTWQTSIIALDFRCSALAATGTFHLAACPDLDTGLSAVYQMLRGLAISPAFTPTPTFENLIYIVSTHKVALQGLWDN